MATANHAQGDHAPGNHAQGPEGRGPAIAAKVAEFLRTTIIPYENDSRITPHGPTDGLVQEMRDKARAAGLITPHILAEGGPLSHRDTAIVFRAAGYSILGPQALNIAAPDEGNMFLLERVASKEQRQRFLEPMISGHARSAFLMTEPALEGGAGSDPGMMMTVARPDGNHWVVNGRKAFITGGQGAKVAIIMAKTPGGATMFLADMETPGINIVRILDTIDGLMPGGHAVVDLDNVRLPADQILGEVDQGFKYAQVRLAPARLTHCMRWWGAARRAHEEAVAYAVKRHAFGKPLVDHEGVGFMLADNLIELKQAELMIDWCAGVLDAGQQGTTESSMTKVAVSEALFRIADRCVQAMGGMGVSRDSVVERIYREIRAFRIYDGPSEVHRWSLAKKIKKEAAGK